MERGGTGRVLLFLGVALIVAWPILAGAYQALGVRELMTLSSYCLLVGVALIVGSLGWAFARWAFAPAKTEDRSR
jgi:hypothetical protein